MEQLIIYIILTYLFQWLIISTKEIKNKYLKLYFIFIPILPTIFSIEYFIIMIIWYFKLKK
jgi:hypothetical protein